MLNNLTYRLAYLAEVLRHPVNKGRAVETLARCTKWYIASHLVPGPVAMPFIENSRLMVQVGERGATENFYTGLSEFQDMAFLLHVLGADDVFVDVGANVGAYTVLASAVRGCRSLAFEPIPATYERLKLNIAVNGIGQLVEAHNVGLSNRAGILTFTAALDTINHVVADDEIVEHAVPVEVRTLDVALSGYEATLIKIDVEGFETAVLAGAAETLQNSRLHALIIETNDSGARYNRQDGDIDTLLARYGFFAYIYEPFTRKLHVREPVPVENPACRNTIYVRDKHAIEARLRSGKTFAVRHLVI